MRWIHEDNCLWSREGWATAGQPAGPRGCRYHRGRPGCRQDQQLASRYELASVTGHASSPSILDQAGAHDAELIISATNSDEVNIAACQVAHSLFAVTTKIARIRSRDYLNPRWNSMFNDDHLPIDKVLFPEQEVAQAALNWLNATCTLDSVPFFEDCVQLVRVRLGMDCPVLNVTVAKLTLQFEGLNAVVVAVNREDEIIIASGDLNFQVGDELFFLVPTDQLVRTLSLFGFEIERTKQVVIFGGGAIGATIAAALRKSMVDRRVRLVEQDPAQARKVAHELTPGAVICGDALDQEVLAEARVEEADAVISVVNDDRVNLLAASYAKVIGAKRVMAIANGAHMRPLGRLLQIDALVAPEMTTVSAFLSLSRRQFVNSHHTFLDNRADVLEMHVYNTSQVISRKIADVIPKTCRVGAVRDANNALQVINGQYRFRADDHVILFTRAEDSRELERLFQVAVGYVG